MNRLTSGVAFGAVIAAALAIPAATAHAQPQSAANGSNPVVAEQSRAAQTGRALGLTDAQGLTVKAVVVDADGSRHVRYDRTFRGLRVIGGDFVVAKDAAGATRHVYWNGSGKVAVASTSPKVPAPGGRGDLVVYAAQGTPRLAWDVLTTGVKADQTPSRLHTITDAVTGAALDSYDEIATGTGNSMYSGSVTLNTISSGSSWLLKDAVGNYTTDLNGATTGTGTQFTDADNIWGTGTVASRQTAGVDAAVRRRADLRLLQERARPQRHLGQRHRRPQPRPLRQRATSTRSGTAPR